MKKILFISAFLLCTVWIAYGQWTYTNLSEPKAYMGATVLGSKAYFAGGYNNSTMLSTVEIYDFTTGEWDITNNLSVARELPFAVACGSKVLFAGGANFNTGAVFSTVDIFDTVTQEWTVEQLSIPRLQAAVVSHGNKVLFAGGANLSQGVVYDIVDIYDIETEVWSTATLSEPRVVWWATVGDLAIFAGGYNLQTSSKRVDIYNFTTDTWSIDSLSVPRAFVGMTTIGSKVMIAGGMTSGNNPSDIVDIYDASAGTWEIAALSFPRAFSDNQNAVVMGGKVYFVGGGKVNLNGAYWTAAYNVIDIYDPVSNAWSVDYLADSFVHRAVVSFGNQFLVAGGITMSNLYKSDVEIYSCSCLPEGITFTTQEQIDNFQTNYPGCTEIEGQVMIGGFGGSNISNLNGLNVLTSIGGDLNIYINNSLTSLIGLESLSSIWNDVYIGGNASLITLTGLESLSSIGGVLYIESNATLTSLTGLDNINAGSITHLWIKQNGTLAICAVQSICDYLANPNGTIIIQDNAPGCNSPEEVQEACLTAVEEFKTGNELTINPNPSIDIITITSPAITCITQLTIFNISGEKVLERQLTDNETQIDISALPWGVYFVRLQNEKMVEVAKMIKG